VALAPVAPSGRLEKPAGVGRISWRYAIPIIGLHLLALAVFVPWLFSWTGLALFIIGIYVVGTGINTGYHRLLTHRSFACPRWVEYTFVVIAVCCMEDAPATWVAMHRLHHKDSDEKPDPHSPLVNFWWGHMGWLMVENRDIKNMAMYDRYARDILKDPFYMWLQRGMAVAWIYLAHLALIGAAGFAVGRWSGGTTEAGLRLGASWLVWAGIARTVAVWHITWSVNSLSHMFGYRTYNTTEHSRNNWLVALLASGEGWHNNHHVDPNSASNWHRWWEFDATYLVIRGLELVGLAKDVDRGNAKRREKHGAE
jgi:fatty-acid desaturase